MDEIVVGLTDYVLTIECAIFAWMLIGIGSARQDIQRFFAAFFAFTGLASLTGGTYHAFLASTSSTLGDVIWTVTIVAIGAAAFAAWSIGACLIFSKRIRGWVVKAALIELVAYSFYVVIIDQHFFVAIANYIPAVIFLGISFAGKYKRYPVPSILIGLIGLAVTGVAAAIQRLGFGLHPVYFNHNAIYHLVQAIGLFLIFYAANLLVRTPLKIMRDS